MPRDRAAISEALLSLIAEGNSLHSACRQTEGASVGSFLRWCDADSELAERYARARCTGADVSFDKLEELQSQEPPVGPDGKVDSGWVAWRRLQVDTMKWALAKKRPQRYGDAITTTHEVGDSIKEITRTIVRAP